MVGPSCTMWITESKYDFVIYIATEDKVWYWNHVLLNKFIIMSNINGHISSQMGQTVPPPYIQWYMWQLNVMFIPLFAIKKKHFILTHFNGNICVDLELKLDQSTFITDLIILVWSCAMTWSVSDCWHIYDPYTYYPLCFGSLTAEPRWAQVISWVQLSPRLEVPLTADILPPSLQGSANMSSSWNPQRAKHWEGKWVSRPQRCVGIL